MKKKQEGTATVLNIYFYKCKARYFRCQQVISDSNLGLTIYKYYLYTQNNICYL